MKIIKFIDDFDEKSIRKIGQQTAKKIRDILSDRKRLTRWTYYISMEAPSIRYEYHFSGISMLEFDAILGIVPKCREACLTGVKGEVILNISI